MTRLVLALALLITTAAQARQPNVVVFLSDDQGWGDLSVNGNKNLSTPHIDSLARDGARFDRFYVSPVCSPTRAEFLTGRYHARGGVYSTSKGGERLDLDETTIADTFRAAGYATGAFGKWHSGMQFPYHPNGRGFDEFYGFCSGHAGNYFGGLLDHNGAIVKGEGFCIDDFTSRAMDFIRANRDRPFFCYIPYNTPHSPMQVPDEFWSRAKDREILMHDRDPATEDELHLRAALAMCENIDWNVGRVLATLDTLGLKEETLVLYFCDNGPNAARWNGDMKGIKGSTDEGGVRSPLLIRWPGKIAAGTTVEVPGSAIDLLPTLAGLAEVPLKSPKPLDGANLRSALLGAPEEPLRDRAVFSTWGQKASIRTPRYRLMGNGALFDMIADPGQRMNVAKDHPETAADLLARLDAHRTEMKRELGTDTRPFVIAHPGAEFSRLTADDGIAKGGIRRSNKFPNDSYYTNWTSPEDAITWPAEVAAAGEYEVEIFYTCPEEDIGSTVEIRFNEHVLEGTLPEAHDSGELGAENDRAPRQESYVKDWHRTKLGTLRLTPGKGDLTLRAPQIPGKQVMDFRMLTLKRKL